MPITSLLSVIFDGKGRMRSGEVALLGKLCTGLYLFVEEGLTTRLSYSFIFFLLLLLLYILLFQIIF